MIIKSIYDKSVEYDTELKTINGSKIANHYYTDDIKLYEYNDTNHDKLSKRGGYNIVIKTEDDNLYGINGARWDGLYKYKINVRM